MADAKLNEENITAYEEEVEEYAVEDEEAGGFGINIFTFDKWKKKQCITLFDFSSLDATISTIAKIVAVVAVIKLIFKKK